VGSNSSTQVTVTPISRFTVPPGLGGASAGNQLSAIAHGVGAPTNPTLTLTSTSNGNGTSTVDARATAQQNGTDSEVRFNIVQKGLPCIPRSGGDTQRFTALGDGETYTFTMCAESWFNGRSYGSVSLDQQVNAEQSKAAPKGYTFRVGAKETIKGNEARWYIDRINDGDPPPRFNDKRFVNWGPGNTIFDRDPEIQVYFQHQVWGTQSQYGAVTPASGSAPYQVQASWKVASCEGGKTLSANGSSSNDKAKVTFNYDNARYFDKNGNQLPRAEGAAATAVPAEAASVDKIRVTVDWSAQGWNLDSASTDFGGECKPSASAPKPSS
jgi:hypothetical protein